MQGIPPPTLASILATPAAVRVALQERRRAAPASEVDDGEAVEPVHDAEAVEPVHDDPRHTGADPDHFQPPDEGLGSHLDVVG